MSPTDDPERMSDVDSLVWASERDPRLRSTIVAVAILDGPVDRRALRNRIDRATRVVPRLRQRAVADAVALTAPRWQVDPEFCLSFHLRLTTFSGQGTRRDLLDLAGAIAAEPFDRSRPLWEITHVEGLTDDGQALILKSHHAVSDGIGGVELSLEIFDLAPEPEPSRDHLPPPPQPQRDTGGGESAVLAEVRATIAATRGALDSLVEAGPDPRTAARRLGAMIGSAARQLGPPTTPGSVTMTDRSLDIALDGFTVSLESLRVAGRRVDGTINDAFVAAVALGLRTYHRRHGDSLPVLRMAIPVNRRSRTDTPAAALGNHWTPGRLEVGIDSDDPDQLMATVRDRMRRLRREPSHELLQPLAAVLRRLPDAVTAPVVAAVTAGTDVAASNVPGSPIPLHLLGRSVEEMLPFGPLTGAATNVTLLSHAEQAHIGVNRDPAAVPDGEVFTADLRDAFAKVLR